MKKAKPATKANRRIWALSVLLSLFTVYIQGLSIQHSASSTAAIGYLFLPVYFCCYLLAYAAVGFLWHECYVAFTNKKQSLNLRFFLLMLSSVLVACYVLLTAYRVIETYRSVHYIQTLSSPDELDALYMQSKQAWLGSYRAYWWATIVLNPHASPQLVARIAAENDDLMNVRLDSWFDLSPGNNFQRSVQRLIKERQHSLNHK